MRIQAFPIAILCFTLLFPASKAPGQTAGTLYLITSIDVLNADISAGCRKDGELSVEVFGGEAARLAGMQFKHINLAFNQHAVTEFLDQFQCEPNDAVIFLYSGHGFRYDDDGDEWPWPYLYLCERDAGNDDSACDYDLEEVYNTLVAKGPRMSITLGSSCNDPLNASDMAAGAVPYEDDASSHQRYLKAELFSQFSGHIIASACSQNQSAYTNIEQGSYFAIELFKAIATALDADRPVSWEYIFRKTKEAVNTLTDGRQTPQFRVRD